MRVRFAAVLGARVHWGFRGGWLPHAHAGKEHRTVMLGGRLRKQLTRAMVVSWREQPTRFDIEALQANIQRVGLVIRVRWILIVVLVLYSVVGGLLYVSHIDPLELSRLMAVPAFSLVLVVLYNTFYARNYRRLGNIAVWNNLQLALDAIVVTVLIYFSGGVNSWFWSMYALFILEATFILPRSRDAWLHAAFSCLLLGAVEWLEFARILPHVTIPFATGQFHLDPIFVSVRYLWQVAVLMGTAGVSINIVGEFRRELAARQALALTDEVTGLYSRTYFLRAFSAEHRRAERDGRPLHVLLLDIDNFNAFNERFGIDAGDLMLREVAGAVSRVLAETGDVIASANLGARYGGEEFAVLFVEDTRLQASPAPQEACGLAEHVRAEVLKADVDGAGVTVSIGVASMPGDGRTMDELMDAADAALARASAAGGNRVVAAVECDASGDGLPGPAA